MSKEFYTPAEFEAMMREEEARDAAKEAIESPIKDAPSVFDEFKDTLTLVACQLDGDEVNAVSSRKLKDALGFTTLHSRWFDRLTTKYGFVEGEDYVALSHNPATVEGRQAIKDNGGQLIYDYMMSVDMAKEVCMVQATPLGRHVRKYFLVAENVAKKYAADQFKKALSVAQDEARQAKRLADRSDKAALVAAKKMGFKSISQLEGHIQQQESRERKEAQAHLEQSKALMLERGVRRMKNAQWSAARCDALLEIIERELARAEREGDCTADPF